MRQVKPQNNSKRVPENRKSRKKRIQRRKRQRRRFQLLSLAIICIGIYTAINIVYSNKEAKTSMSSKITIKSPSDISVLVNKKRALPSYYIPEDLVVPNVDFIFEDYADRRNLRKPAAQALEELFNAAELEGYNLMAVSGYRSYDYQKELFDNEVAQCGNIETANTSVAMPGESEHQTGLAMDICCSVSGNVLGGFEGTPEAEWVYEHCHEYGFILRYPKGKTDITGYMYEPWHIRYVGKKISKEVKEKDLTYDEYYETYLE